ncbi:MAG: DegT/DnrJ/EryC1/StrS family aminotransferase [Chitinivibrionales bacterium]|nr:DegT/DnrJ/EryC1/StrS family aminotransferase [Chitinivibrionales bacterium]
MKKDEPVPFLDVATPHRVLKAELMAVVDEALSTGRFVGGPNLEKFESAFAQFCTTKHCVGVANGTDALRFAYIAAGIQPKDIVITVAHTFIATTEAISQVGASIVFVDINEATYTLDPQKLEQFLKTECTKKSDETTIHTKSGQRVKAVVPVHLYGQTADMDPILELAQQYNLLVIEDACQSHGAAYYSKNQKCWKTAGSMGIAAAFSFYPGKNLGACGEAGAVTTNDAAIAEKIRMIREHGQKKKYIHDMEGYNGRLDAIQAGFLAIKLKHLAQWNTQRHEHAVYYNQLLKDIKEVVTTPHLEWRKGVYHLYIIVLSDTKTRDALQQHLNNNGIGTGLHYPIPLHLQTAYSYMGHTAGSFPVSEKIASQCLSLPMFPELTQEQQQRVVAVIKDFFKR